MKASEFRVFASWCDIMNVGKESLSLPPGWILDRLATTSYDVAQHPMIAGVAEGRDEYVGLALWLMAERAQGSQSTW